MKTHSQKKTFQQFFKIFLATIPLLSFANNKDLISEHGKYGQTWINGNLIIEIQYTSAKECVETMSQEISKDKNIKKAITETKNLSLLCSENPSTKTEKDDAGLATGGLTYEGSIINPELNTIYKIWVSNRNFCESLKGVYKKQRSKQILICP
jgi:hypothetical protein